MSGAHSHVTAKRQQMRRELLRQYMRLQRELLDTDPASPAYQSHMHAFRQMGYVMITSGFEDDLDRLLRIRVLDGGRSVRSSADERHEIPEIHVLEAVPIPN